MSVQTNQFLMYGVKLDPEKLPDGFYDKYESYMNDSAYNTHVEHKNGLFICYDGMSGRFAIAGRVFAKSDDEGCLSGIYEINKLFTEKEKDDISTMLILHLNELLPKDGEWECDYIFLTQYR